MFIKLETGVFYPSSSDLPHSAMYSHRNLEASSSVASQVVGFILRQTINDGKLCYNLSDIWNVLNSERDADVTGFIHTEPYIHQADRVECGFTAAVFPTKAHALQVLRWSPNLGI